MSSNTKLAVLTAAALMALPGSSTLASAATLHSAHRTNVNIMVHARLPVNRLFRAGHAAVNASAGLPWVSCHCAAKPGTAATPSVAGLRYQPSPRPASSAPSTIAGRPVVAEYQMVATGYGPSTSANYPYGPVDAFGQPLTPGMVAVDPRVIPLKSYVYVEGYHDPSLPAGGFLGRAMDTGGAIQGHRIDIFINAGHQTVSHFGIESVRVFVLGNPSPTQSAPGAPGQPAAPNPGRALTHPIGRP